MDNRSWMFQETKNVKGASKQEVLAGGGGGGGIANEA